ncbi:GAF domain-containing sensor histidine kinase, partial [Patescibacteria group bacterium]|nr:GAF domain-containing sensor histidine kinase [Patescibacteria group bacterium]
LCGHAAFIKQPYFSNDVEKDPYYISRAEMPSVKSELAVPILLEKKVIGVIKIDSDEAGRFKDEDVELMTTLANNAAIAISNSQMYEEIKDLNKNLEAKVLQRTEELKIANQKLEKSIELKSQFIADASHELRTPLTIIKGNLDISLLDEKIKTKDLRETLESIDEEVGRMSGILADLMILTHAGAGKLNLKKTNANLGALLKTVAQSMEILAKDKDIKIDIVEGEKINVVIDEDKFLKLLLNLVSNAIKYGKKNGWVKLSAESTSRGVDIRISDNGIGIPENEVPYVFERFYRVDKVRTREKIGGSGLGLAICKSIAEAHGGYIDVQSKLGEGSQFIVHLPNNKIDFGEG